MQTIVKNLTEEHGCHTVILYGSRARGDATADSDYDLLGIRKAGKAVRDGRYWKGVYLDIFIYPQTDLEEPHVGMLDMRFGRVLKDDEDFADQFFKKLDAVFIKGPTLYSVDEIVARRTWYRKVLARIRVGGLQGNVRRHELAPVLLEDFFRVRGEWYLGSKAAFQWLATHRPDLYSAFVKAFEPTASIEDLESMVDQVDAVFTVENRPASADD